MTLREELAKMLHAKFISTIQMYGNLHDAQFMFVSYNELSEPDRYDLRTQADEILNLIKGNDLMPCSEQTSVCPECGHRF